jgi:hypothetical protein
MSAKDVILRRAAPPVSPSGTNGEESRFRARTNLAGEKRDPSVVKNAPQDDIIGHRLYISLIEDDPV